MAENPEHPGGKRVQRRRNPRAVAATETIRLEAGAAPESQETHPGIVDLSSSNPELRPGPRLAPLPPAPAPHLPPVTEIRCLNTTRLLPAKYSDSVLTRVARDDQDLQSLFALDNATNDRLLAEGSQRLGITVRELVFEVPYARIINAAFTHPHPLGARFSMPWRGAWYAGLELATAKAEVLFHRAVQFAEIGWQQTEELDYDQYTADFCGGFHDLRPGLTAGGAAPAEFAACLAPDSYVRSQRLAAELLDRGSLGIVYPSARRPGGSCLACFRPSLVGNVQKRDLYRLRWYPDRAATFVRCPRP